MKITEYIKILTSELGRLPTVGFLGFGLSSRALFADAPRLSTVIRCDGAAPEDFDVTKYEGVRLLTGSLARIDITEDVLFLSPSVRRDTPELMRAAERGTRLISDAELYFLDSPPSVFGVTGSDGKSTTTAIASLLLGVPAVGNIGVPFARAPMSGGAVAELSSFQLSYLQPHLEAAVITSLSPNHLDWHSSYEEYISAKLGIFENAARCIISIDNGVAEDYLKTGGRDFFAIYSQRISYPDIKAYRAEHYITLEGEYIAIDGTPYIDTRRMKRREWYNIDNFMGAIALTLGYADRRCVCEVAESFSGLPSRARRILSLGDVDFIDSSIDTTPSRTAATLTALDRPVSIILGGRSKGVPLSELVPLLSRYAYSVAIYGECREEYKSAIGDAVPQLGVFPDFKSAVGFAIDAAHPYSAVLLSPAATSYGEFSDYKERAASFNYIVKKYAHLGK